MNAIIERVGWTLVNSLWEGTVIWLGLRIALGVLHRSSAQVRYLAACGALVLAVGAPWVTYLRIDPGAQVRPPMAAGVTDAVAPWDAGAVVNVIPSRALASVSWSEVAVESMSHLLPWVVLFWIVGFVWSAARLAAGWRVARRLRRTPRQSLGGVVEQQCNDLARRLGIKRMIQIGASTLVEVPSVVSWLKPVILVPAGAFVGLTPLQVEGLIAHELAHVVRHDFMVNILQLFCDVVFFYHPAIRVINGIIRTEREHACDDIAVKLVGDPHGYAAALAHLEETRHPELVLAASGQGRLLNRIRRLVAPGARPNPRPLGAAWVVLAGVVLYVATLAVIPGLAPRARAAQPSEPAEASVAAPTELFRIGAGDRLRVVVFDGTTPKDSLGFSLRCDAEGNLLVPVIGPVHVLGLTLAQAGKVLEGAYRRSFNLTAPNVTVMVLAYAPREVTVSGQVRSPSRYEMPIEGSLTPLELVLRAGGFTDTADGSAVRVLTVLPDGTTQVTVVDVEKLLEGRAFTRNDTRAATLQLKPGDIVFVPTQSPPVAGAARENIPHPYRSNFEAMAALQFSPPASVTTASGTTDPSAHSLLDMQFYEQALQSTRLRQRVIASYSPAELEMLRRPYAETAAFANIFGITTSESDSANHVIYIFSKHPDPAAAALIANRFASQFMAMLEEEVRGKDVFARDFLRQRADALRQASKAADQELESFKSEHGVGSGADTHAELRAQSDLLQKKAEAAKAAYGQMQARLRETEAAISRSRIPLKQIVFAKDPES